MSIGRSDGGSSSAEIPSSQTLIGVCQANGKTDQHTAISFPDAPNEVAEHTLVHVINGGEWTKQHKETAGFQSVISLGLKDP